MVSASEIKDEETLRAWLEGRPQTDAVAIAHRAALRVLPITIAEANTERGTAEGITGIFQLHALLVQPGCLAQGFRYRLMAVRAAQMARARTSVTGLSGSRDFRQRVPDAQGR